MENYATVYGIEIIYTTEHLGRLLAKKVDQPLGYHVIDIKGVL